jgi:hypothetical protein
MASHVKPDIILYDLACTKSVSFSPAVWRIRLMLNYKNIPYKTIFLEFPDIEPTLKELWVTFTSFWVSFYSQSLRLPFISRSQYRARPCIIHGNGHRLTLNPSVAWFQENPHQDPNTLSPQSNMCQPIHTLWTHFRSRSS